MNDTTQELSEMPIPARLDQLIQAVEANTERIRQLGDERDRLQTALNAATAMNGVHERTIARLRGQSADRVSRDVAVQRERHLVQWGERGAHHRDGTGPDVVWAFTGPASYVAQCAVEETRRAFAEEVGTWRDIQTEEVAEAHAERDPAALRARLIRIAAVAQDWAADIDSREQAPAQDAPVETAGSAT